MLTPPDLTDGEPARPEAPFDERADGEALLRDAVFKARGEEKRTIVVFGANWCPDARALAGVFEHPVMAGFLEAHAVPVLIDVGRYDRNETAVKAVNVHPLEGLPAVVILDPDGAPIDPEGLYRWRSARDEEAQTIADWFALRLSPAFAPSGNTKPGATS